MRTNTLAVTASAALIAACASPTPYEQAGPTDETGYTTSQVAANTYRVSFEGNEVTSRQTVETYLLYRAAQVAENTGHPYFAFLSRDVEEQIDLDTYQTYDTTPGFYGYGPGYGFGGFSYYSTFPYGTGVGTGLSPYGQTRVTTDDSYEAQAVIEVYETEPSGVTNVMNASEVIARLDSEIRRPGEDEGMFGMEDADSEMGSATY